jgi:hypothetical protein
MTVVSYVYLLMSFENKEKRLSFDDKTKTVFCDGHKVISVRDGSGNYRFIKYIFERKCYVMLGVLCIGENVYNCNMWLERECLLSV